MPEEGQGKNDVRGGQVLESKKSWSERETVGLRSTKKISGTNAE